VSGVPSLLSLSDSPEAFPASDNASDSVIQLDWLSGGFSGGREGAREEDFEGFEGFRVFEAFVPGELEWKLFQHLYWLVFWLKPSVPLAQVSC
jgi:hypothetical protein